MHAAIVLSMLVLVSVNIVLYTVSKIRHASMVKQKKILLCGSHVLWGSLAGLVKAGCLARC